LAARNELEQMVASDATELNRMEVSLAAAKRLAVKKGGEAQLQACALYMGYRPIIVRAWQWRTRIHVARAITHYLYVATLQKMRAKAEAEEAEKKQQGKAKMDALASKFGGSVNIKAAGSK
jgi:hypothetical protein